MIDQNFIIENVELIKDNCIKRNADIDVENIASLIKRRKEILGIVENIRMKINELTRSIRPEAIDETFREKIKELKQEEKSYSLNLNETEAELQNKLLWLPNILDSRVPIGNEEQNIVIKENGKARDFDFHELSHEEIGTKLNLIDIPRGVKAAKTRFYCLKNEAVLLRWALTKMFFDNAKKQGFELICPPYLAKNKTLLTSGYLPFADKDNFKIEGEDLSLIGTSEQALLGIHMDETLTSLPLLYLGDSMCFRTEAGSYGRDTAGIIRVHQFYKLEQVVYCKPEDSEYWHKKCLENEEYMMEKLEIPYRVVLTASEDISYAGKIKYDIEGWFPSQKKYRELTSNTNLGDYQTRRGNIRYKIDGKKGYPHTISATGFCDRLLICLLENYQTKNGDVIIPNELIPYMNGMEIISSNK